MDEIIQSVFTLEYFFSKEGHTRFMAQSPKSQLAMEQPNNSKLIARLQDEIKAKESVMSLLQNMMERLKTNADMKSRLETYRQDSENVIGDSKKKIASLTLDFKNH
jgi:hypothetical protein